MTLLNLPNAGQLSPVALLGLVWAVLTLHWFPVPVPAADRPNVVLIMADDVSWECFGCYGAEDYLTPNIDALAAEGIQFKHCYSTPICTTSRVQIMTGKYNFRNYTHFGYLRPDQRTFGHMMKDAGYHTAIAGKWQLNGLSHNADGAKDSTRPIKAGFDEYCLWQLSHPKGAGERFWSPVLERNGKLLTKDTLHEQYGPDVMSDFVCDFITRHKDEPFFVYYPTVLVHDPFVPTPDSVGDGPKTHDANKAPKSKDKQKQNFVAMVAYLDKIVGKVVRHLESVGQRENTIIMFTADNGTNVRIQSNWNGRVIKGGKAGPTDMGTHVPFVASWKGKSPEGVVTDDLVDFTDFFPTLAEASGQSIQPSNTVDGQSFLPQLTGKPATPRETVFCHYQPYWGRFPGTQFLRNQTFKLYRDGRFYHVPEDLEEQNDLAAASMPATGASVHARFAKTFERMPPAPTTEGGNKIKERPIYPDWKLPPQDAND